MRRKNEGKKKEMGFHVIGSIVVAAGAFIAMPKIIDFLSTKMYSKNPASNNEDEDDWGPEIVRKEKTEEDKLNGDI